ncbi:MAG TPA: STAS domain-containing protein [Stellaceae bacterium]|jgi:anti-anti-sigma factor|nr:STAS domain-containing protein [Stellaceae bacterium]
MDFAHEQAGDAIIVRLAGKLDGSAARTTEANLSQVLADSEPRVAIDMSQVDYLSSAGLRVLLLVAKKAQRAKGKLVLFDCCPNVMEVLSISGFDKLVPIHTGSAAAIAATR